MTNNSRTTQQATGHTLLRPKSHREPFDTSLPPLCEEKKERVLNRDFGLLISGQFISRLGTSVTSIVMILWIKEATGSASLMGLMSMLTGIPSIVLGIVGGTFADRYSRRKIIAYCDLLSGVGLFILAAMFYLFPGHTTLLLGALVAVSVFASVADAFSSPAISAAIPDIVPSTQIARANSLGQFSMQLAVFLGQAIGGVMFRVLGIFLVSLANGFTYIMAGFGESFMEIPQQMKERRATWRQRLAEFGKDASWGLQYLWGIPGLRNIVLVSSILSFLFGPVIVLIPYYVSDLLRQQDDWVGFLSATYGVGSLVGYLSAGVKEFGGKTRRILIIGFMLLESCTVTALGLTSSPTVALVVVFLSGAFSGTVSVYFVSIIQMTTPSETRGRMFGFLATISGSLAPLGMGLGGVVFDWTGQNIMAMYAGCGITMTLLIAILSLNRDFNRFIASEVRTETEPTT